MSRLRNVIRLADRPITPHGRRVLLGSLADLGVAELVAAVAVGAVTRSVPVGAGTLIACGVGDILVGLLLGLGMALWFGHRDG